MEWKLYDYDQPADSAERLLAAGFAAGDEELMLVAESAAIDSDVRLPDGVRLDRVTGTAGVEAMVAVHDLAFAGHPSAELGERLVTQLREAPELVQMVLAMAGDEPVSAARVEFIPGTDFAGLWGGGTVPAWRGRGIFRALVAYRAGLAAARGYRYLQVDALPASLPILERLGFKPAAATTPYVGTAARRLSEPARARRRATMPAFQALARNARRIRKIPGNKIAEGELPGTGTRQGQNPRIPSRAVAPSRRQGRSQSPVTIHASQAVRHENRAAAPGKPETRGTGAGEPGGRSTPAAGSRHGERVVRDCGGQVRAFAGASIARLLTRPAAVRQASPSVCRDKARVSEPSPTAIPGHGQPKDAVDIAQAYGATATTALPTGAGRMDWRRKKGSPLPVHSPPEAFMTSGPVRDPLADHLLTPQNCALVIIDYRPPRSVRPIHRCGLLVDLIVHLARFGMLYPLPVVLSTVDVRSGRNQPTIGPLQDVLPGSRP